MSTANGQPHASKYSSGVLHDLDLAHPHRQSFGFSINNAGDVAGTLGLSRHGRSVHRQWHPGLPRGAFNLVLAWAINDFDQVTGMGLSGTEEHAFLITGHKSWLIS